MKNYLYTILIIAPFLFAQEEAPVDPNEERISDNSGTSSKG